MANELLFKEESYFGHYPKLEYERLAKLIPSIFV